MIKPTIRRCFFCFERFEDPLSAHYKRPSEKGSADNCKQVNQLAADGWVLSKDGVWIAL